MVHIKTKVNIMAEQIRHVLLLVNNRMAYELSGTTVPKLVPQKSSLLWTILLPVDKITLQPGEDLAYYRELGKICD